MEISGKTALVSGGASGLGYATVEKLASCGARVAMVDLPSSAGQEKAKRLGSGVVFVGADVTREDDIKEAVSSATSLGDLAIVVNCAGIGNAIRTVSKHGPFPLESFAKIVQVNLIGTFNVIRLAVAAMIERDEEGPERGVVINTASVAAFDGQIGQTAYSASKGGIVSMTLPMARDLARFRIRVNTIAPGLFRTPLLEPGSPETIAALEAQVPHPSRLGHPEEYAELAAHIISNPMLNGETIRLDGALRMAPR
jgi:NAD(P)-dependent dehydrogenase (short-subunit alcohol dehydrogenase family)